MKFTKTILPNGLRLVTIPMTDNPSVTLLVVVETGSKYETKEISGISHFLEHMMFKGTPRRPNATDITRELDGLGANYNAFTSQEYTGYYIKVSAGRFDEVVDIMADLYLNPLFKTEDMEKEKGVIIEEIRMYQDLPQRDIQDIFNALMFGDQPAGWSVLGTEDHVRSYTREQLVEYRNQHYVSQATTIIVSGSFDETATTQKIEKAFAGVSISAKKDKVPVVELQSAPAIKLKYKETDQTHLVIGFRTFPILDPRMATMSVLSTILGGGMSSRLFARMRDQLGMCYYVRSSHNPNTDHGDLTISAGVDTSRVHEAVKEILAQVKAFKHELLSDAELKKAKDYIAGTTVLELETSEARAEYVGYQEMLKKKIELPEEILARIQQVTAADIQQLAQEIFVDAGLNMAIVGKYKDEAVFKEYFSVEK
jgi:predicted Zn-dependent peptidase